MVSLDDILRRLIGEADGWDGAIINTKEEIKELVLDTIGHTSFTKGDTYDKTLIVSSIANFQNDLRKKVKEW